MRLLTPPTDPTDMESRASSRQHCHRKKASETALTRTQIRQARYLITNLNSSVRNKFRNAP